MSLTVPKSFRPKSLVCAILGASMATPILAADNSEAEASVQLDGTVSAEELLTGDVKHVSNRIGRIKDVLLSDSGERAEIVLYRVPNRYKAEPGETGYAVLNKVEVEQETDGVDVLLIGEESQRKPEKLRLTRADLSERSMERLIGQKLILDGGYAYPVVDIRIDADSGRISHYVIDTDPEQWLDDDSKIVPADKVSRTPAGQLKADVSHMDLDQLAAL